MARATQASARTQRAPHAKQRAAFTELLLANPNHFGNFPESGLEPVFVLEANTAYEQLTCVGYNPDRDELEATVQIKLPSGYGGDLCSAGSTEYVRFYVDYGAGWQDAGLASFNAHDIANANDCAAKPTKPLTYVVTYPHAPRRSYCRQPTLPKVRAILSWNAMPPAGNPGWAPVWGNTVDRHVQIRPRLPFLVDWPTRSRRPSARRPSSPRTSSTQSFSRSRCRTRRTRRSPSSPSSTPSPSRGPREAAEATEAVEPHRFGLQELQAASTLAFVSQASLSSKYAEWEELGLDLQATIAALEETKNDVSYEQLDCLGLDYNRGWLVASLTIKRPTGYLGTLCQRGSFEYVAFWADWEDTCKLEYVGTVKLNVHDIASIPADGLHYWVGLPVTAELAKHRGPCQKPKLARIRAVLSWNAAPSTVNPDAVPHWGNRLDAHVEIRPGRPVSNQAEIDVIGGISVSQIDVAGNGMTRQGAVFAEWGSPADPFVIGALPGGGTGSTRLCPFGGRVNVQADVPASFAASGHKYRLMTHEVGSMAPPKPVTTPFLTTAGINPPVWRTPDPVTGYVSYLDPSQNVYNMLGWWETGKLGDGLWELWLEMVDASLAPIGSTARASDPARQHGARGRRRDRQRRRLQGLRRRQPDQRNAVGQRSALRALRTSTRSRPA